MYSMCNDILTEYSQNAIDEGAPEKPIKYNGTWAPHKMSCKGEYRYEEEEITPALGTFEITPVNITKIS